MGKMFDGRNDAAPGSCRRLLSSDGVKLALAAGFVSRCRCLAKAAGKRRLHRSALVPSSSSA
jgi:hypothetical protein